MEKLKQFFPFSFKKKPEVSNLVVTVIIHAVIAIVVGSALSAIGLLLGTVGIIFTLLGSLIDLYLTAGIVLTFLHYFKVIKIADGDSAEAAPEVAEEEKSNTDEV